MAGAKRSIIWTVSAFKDLQNIVEFISQDSTYYGLAFYDDIMNKAQSLIDFPQRGRIVPEMDDPNLREVFVHRYRLIYQIHPSNIIIKTIVHGARDIFQIDDR
ncbi:type II toxin-antitoxin system RelE/ParE family toxin [Bacillus horti]|uniref:Plasmid stabilization system protein ParE n=1 Tax=Caldalkalibacillus horti TaxID=77523 RepID=A0ABT9W250_9BACI|nr:type II toxin-antitoxin system RelE/ParE family toxin [Bacillus horti]MDQ0167324.1 plasmid stabilization system protein ParE [Bacillus horti]